MRVRPCPAMSLGITLGVLTAAWTPACNRANPLYRGRDAGDLTGAAGANGAGGALGGGGDQGGGAGGVSGTAGDGFDAGPPLDASTGVAGRDGGVDATLGACRQAGDCLTARGAPLCGAWECRAGRCAVICSACADNDNDGFGVGAGCAGPDCDDNDPTVGRASARSCYEGKGGTLGVGACRAGAQSCTEGLWSTCGGQVLPSGEACNGVDDDCNGRTDDGLGVISCGLGACAQAVAACAGGVLGVCKPGTPALADVCDGKDNDCNGAVDDGCDTACVHVAPNGDDMAATGTALRPFRSIQAAVDFAAGALARPKNVCVAGGNSCADTNIYPATDGNPLAMANGVSVYGNYEALTWSRCPFGTVGLPNLTVTIAARTAAGVTFPATVTTPTTLDGVRIARFNGGGGSGSTAGITVSGAKQVQISNVVIDDAQNAMASYGVNLTGGAEAVITRSAIFGGSGSAASIGVRSVGSKPTIRDNCATVDATTGHCTSACAPTSLGIHGRSPQVGGGNDNGAMEAVAIDLIDSPGAVVERNAVCGTPGATGDGVRIAGAAAGTVVRGNSITADGGTTMGLGISLLACGDAAPWIVDNEVILGDPAGTATRAAGVYVVGPCHPVIDGNTKIATGGGAAAQSAFGVFCGADANGVSRCSVTGNKLIQGSPTARPAQTVAVACDAGGCARVSGNTMIGQGGATVVGLSLRATSAFVDRNVITGGCGSKTTTAVLAEDALSRIENNLVRGAACGANGSTPEADGLRVLVALGGNEVDVSSNTIDAGGSGACQGVAAGIGLGTAGGPKTPHGIFRDNILRAGACSIGRIAFIETETTTTPRLFVRNDLDPTGTPTSLYLRPGVAGPPTITAINMFAGASGNISADPAFVGATDFHLSAGSPCVNAGTSVGAPKTDFDGKARDDHPDIGAYER